MPLFTVCCYKRSAKYLQKRGERRVAKYRRGNRPNPYSYLVAAILLSVVVGCGSIRSTMLTITRDGWIHGQSNGYGKRFGMARPYRGVPVKLKVPAYLRVTVYENAYLYDNGTTLNEYQLSAPDRSVEQQVVDAEKVFFVDFARPLSGTSSYRAEIDPQSGYFKTVSGTVTDNSITDISKLITASTSLVMAAPATITTGTTTTGTSPQLKDQLLIQSRVVAQRYFDINACDLDAQVSAFIDEHVNCGHSCANAIGDGRCSRSVSPTSCDCSVPKARIDPRSDAQEGAGDSNAAAASGASRMKKPIAQAQKFLLPSPTPAEAASD